MNRGTKKNSPVGIAKRESLLMEAEKVFAEKGFQGTSIRDIARATGSNVALIYYYFKSKEDLYVTVLDEAFRRLSDYVRGPLAEGGDEEERLRLVIRAYIAFMGSRADLPRIMAREMAEGGKYIALVMKNHLYQNYSMLQQTIEKGIGKGIFNPVSIELTPLTMMGMMGFFFFASPVVTRLLAVEHYDEKLLDDLAEHTINLFFKGIIRRKEEEVQ